MEWTRGHRGWRTGALAAGLASVCALAAFVVASAQASPGQPALNVGPPSGIVFAHGQGNGRPSGGTSSPDMTYHGGPVLTGGAAVTPIFWGTSWNATSDAGGKIVGMQLFYRGVGGSAYAGTNTEYTDASGTHVSSSVSYNGYLIDNSAAPSKAPSTSTIQAEVAKEITNPVANGYYPVYVDTPRGHARYCAWHSYGTVNDVVVQFAFFFNLDNDPGCDPNSTVPNQSEGLKALGNVSGHELSETLTDPHVNAWYDGSGAENADKCAWTFGQPYLTLSNGTHWKIQGNWSNAAYDTNQGYTSSGTFVRGCIDGG
jgi:hypothetical protein